MDNIPELLGCQDACLIAICDGKKPPLLQLKSLPPWRAVLIGRVALQAGLMTDEEVHNLVEEAKIVGGSGKLTITGLEN